MKRGFLLIALIACGPLPAETAFAQAIPFDSDRWTISGDNSRIERHLGRESLLLQGGEALLEDVQFSEGTIEFAIAFPADRNFTGVSWHRQEGHSYEEFYFRPHQSGQPDANQYTPVFNGVSGWQLYYGASFATPVEYPFDTWIPVRIVVSGGKADVYIMDMDSPAVAVGHLKLQAESGGIGISAGNLSPVHFADFRVNLSDRPTLKGTPSASPEIATGTVRTWSVSNAIEESRLQQELPATLSNELTWSRLEVEDAGVANLARLQGVSEGANTALARVIIEADRNFVRPVEFGFSDRVQVYLNGKRVYSGNNNYTSRDHRFLGTIGLFDTLYLSLIEGRNELVFAVSENFGGWGIQARFPDETGISVTE